MVGPWYTFLQTTTLFGFIGAIFGIARTFRNMSIDWYEGATKKRLARAAIANLLILPSWVFVILAEGNNATRAWVRDIGLNNFFIDSLHWFLLYLFLFGYMPTLVFQPCQLVNESDEEFFIVPEPQEQGYQEL